jgi:UDP-N-acetylmuramoyl-tripeptide--D-alanyl-D-alanine ligase
MERTLQFVRDTCGGEPHDWNPAATFCRVCTDTRQLQAGDLFLALRGDNFNGNRFAKKALENGAVAVVLDEPPAGARPCLVVPDSRRALGQLGAAHRQLFNLPLFAIAGSNGKTSTKAMLASILREQFDTLHSEASFNNDIGVPATLLQLEPRHQAAVLEVGTNHPGELAPLIEMVAPQFGLLTGIGREHLEHFGDLDGVAREEGALAELLPAGGKLFINGDGDWVPAMVNRCQASVATVGLDAGRDWRVTDLRVNNDGTNFVVHAPNAAFDGEYHTPLLGAHQAANATLAIAAAAELKIDRAKIARGLAASPVPKMRLQWSERSGICWLNDAYNANADSVRAALATLASLQIEGKKYAVLGDMAELGEHAEAAHREAGNEAAGVVDGLIAVGVQAELTATAARDAGLAQVTAVADAAVAAEVLREWLQRGDVVLLKASRAARLEQLEELI